MTNEKSSVKIRTLHNEKCRRGFFPGGMALPARFERATFRLGGGCSILLSYGSMYLVNSLAILTQKWVYVNKYLVWKETEC